MHTLLKLLVSRKRNAEEKNLKYTWFDVGCKFSCILNAEIYCFVLHTLNLRERSEVTFMIFFHHTLDILFKCKQARNKKCVHIQAKCNGDNHM